MRFSTKRALSLLVAICMLAAMLPATLIGASAAEVGTVYSYKFWEAMSTAGATGTTSAFSTDYQASQNAGVGSAPWMLVSTTNNYYAVSTAPYHIFCFNVHGGSDVVTWKINVPEDAQYVASFDFYEYGQSSPVDVYLAPVDAADATAGEYLLMQIDKTVATGALTDRTVSSLSKMLTAGDYYLIAKQNGGGVQNQRYFTHKAFNLEVVGEYDADAIPEISKIEFDKEYVYLGMDNIDFITPYILPEEADTGDVVLEWESSDENVVIVDEGLISPIGPGFATVTATAPNGVKGTAYVLVTDKGSFVYDFSKGYRGGSSTDLVPLEDMTYAQTMAGSPSEVRCSKGDIATDPWAFESLSGTISALINSSCGARGYQLSAKPGTTTLRISLPVAGTYTPSVEYCKGNGYGSATFYLAPADAVNPIAEEYALGGAVDFNNGGSLTEGNVTKFEEIELDAGEYLISADGNYPALFWKNFKLIDPNSVGSVAFNHDSIEIAVGETRTIGALVLPDSAPDKSITLSSNDACVVVNADGSITGVSKGTATVTAAAQADPTKTDTVTVTVGGKNFYYDFMKSNGFGLAPNNTTNKNPTLKSVKYSQDFKYTTTGTVDEVAPTYVSNGWKIGSVVNSGDWIWSLSAVSLGLYVNVNKDAAASGYASIHLNIPVAGKYDLISVHSLWTGGASADYYLAPVGAEDPVASDYKVNAEPVNHKDGTNHTTEAIVGEVTVPTAGEYVLSFRSDGAASGMFIRGIRLADAEAAVPVESIVLDQTGTISIVDGETLAVTGTVLPVNATDKTYTLTSSDESVAKVVDGVVTPVGAGTATITATANDGSGVSASFDVLCNMTLKYKYDFYNSMKTLYGIGGSTANIAAELNAFGVNYEASITAGSDPWMFAGSKDSVYGLNSKYEYFNYTSSSNNQGYGVFGMNYGTVGAWNSVKIKVGEAGKYTGMLKVSDFPTSNDFDIYVAPVFASDRVADEYKVGSYTVSGQKLNTTQIALDTVSMPAGEYYVTFMVTKVNGGTLIGLFDLELYYSGALEAFEAPLYTIATADGASIRTKGVQGLRFVSSIEKSEGFGKLVEYGTILIPTADLNGDNANLVLGYKNRVLETKADGKVAVKSNHQVEKVPATVLYGETDDEVTFTAVITNIAAANFTREISARAYAIYEDEAGNRHVVYGSTVTSRSPYTVAQNGLADENASEADKAVFRAIVDAVEGNA